MTWPAVRLGELMPTSKSSIDPRKSPDQEFDLFSIPAFDAGRPDLVRGADVGSSKQTLLPGDVLLSKIVPHIRRACVVPSMSRRPMIGSSEWIIFRSERFEPAYLRHALVSDQVHSAFMQTVAGVGGSLLRARPSHVAEIEIPLPPIEEQLRIASILDAADALRSKRRHALDKLEALTQSMFIDTFGDPVANDRSWPRRALRDVCQRIQIGPFGSLLHQSDYMVGGIPIVNPMHIVDGAIRPRSDQTVPLAKYEQLASYQMQTGDVVMGRRGEMGRCAVVGPAEDGWLCGSGSLFLRPDTDQLAPLFLASALSSRRGRNRLERLAQGVTMLNLNSEMVETFVIGLPPIEAQAKFATATTRWSELAATYRQSLTKLDALFASLQHRAFRGEL